MVTMPLIQLLKEWILEASKFIAGSSCQSSNNFRHWSSETTDLPVCQSWWEDLAPKCGAAMHGCTGRIGSYNYVLGLHTVYAGLIQAWCELGKV